MKRDDTKKNFTALSGNDLKTVHPHYLSFPCFIAFVTISKVFCLMRYGSVQNAEIYLFCSENRNFFLKKLLFQTVSRARLMFFSSAMRRRFISAYLTRPSAVLMLTPVMVAISLNESD